MKVLIRVSSHPKLLEDTTLLDLLLATEGWQTLMTFTRESGANTCAFIAENGDPDCLSESTAPAKHTSSTPGGFEAIQDDMQDAFDQIAAQEAAHGSGTTSRGVKICPHCTFENDHGGSDCEVCGLPLN